MNRKKILIVDDEVGFTRLLQLNLNWTGRYATEVVNDASAALRAAHKFHPDLILLDVMMPGLDGGEVANRLQSHSTTKHIPILFVTAAARKNEIHSHHGQIGGLSYVAKPVDLEELMQRIDELLACRSPALLGRKLVNQNRDREGFDSP